MVAVASTDADVRGAIAIRGARARRMPRRAAAFDRKAYIIVQSAFCGDTIVGMPDPAERGGPGKPGGIRAGLAALPAEAFTWIASCVLERAVSAKPSPSPRRHAPSRE